MKIRRFIKKRRRRFAKAIVNGLNGAHVPAADRQAVLDRMIAYAMSVAKNVESLPDAMKRQAAIDAATRY